MYPPTLNGGNVHTLVGRMHTAQGGAKGDHVERGVLLEEEATLETGMDGFHLGFGADEALV